MQTVIKLDDVTAAYQGQIVLHNINATISKGDFVGIIGPNGAGKSTLLKTMVGLITPTNGAITYYGAPFAKHARKIAYIPQRFDVDWDFPITVLEVVLMGRYCHIGWFARPKKDDYAIASHALQAVGMHQFADRPIRELSGGQQQRVFLARALAQEADIYLLDEPLVGIDITTEQAIIKILKKEQSTGKTICMVHHDLQTVTEYFDTLLILNKRQVAFGPVGQVYQKQIVHQAYNRQVCMPNV